MLFAIAYVTDNYMAEQCVVPAEAYGFQSLQGQWRWLFSPRGVVRQVTLCGVPNEQAVPAQCGGVRLGEEKRYVCAE